MFKRSGMRMSMVQRQENHVKSGARPSSSIRDNLLDKLISRHFQSPFSLRSIA